MPSRYRFYLRVSPIFCIVHSTSLLMYVLSACLFDARVPSEVLREIRRSLRDSVGTEEAALQLKATSKETLFRWLFFIFGGILPSIKLSALQGVPLTKAWGLMYLASYLIIESLNLMAVKKGEIAGLDDGSDPTRPLGQAFAPYLENGPRDPEDELSISAGFAVMHFFSVVAQSLLILIAGAVIQHRLIFGRSKRESAILDDPDGHERIIWRQSTDPHSVLDASMVWLWFMIHLIVILILVPEFFGIWEPHGNRLPPRLRFAVRAFLIGSWATIMFISISWTARDMLGPVLLWYVPLYSLNALAILAVKLALGSAAKRSRTIRENRCLEAAAQRDDVGQMAVWAATFFLVHIAVAALWYAFVYDPRWTYNLGWLAVFG